MPKNPETLPDPDRIIHERARLRILVYLASEGPGESGFTDIKASLGMTAGNLSAQLATLEAAGYVRLMKGYSGKKPYTGVSLSLKGERALERYLDEMEQLLKTLKESAKRRG
ncbi:MAG TPA: transcriptional regulator [Rectinemataceae bacterium]